MIAGKPINTKNNIGLGISLHHTKKTKKITLDQFTEEQQWRWANPLGKQKIPNQFQWKKCEKLHRANPGFRRNNKSPCTYNSLIHRKSPINKKLMVFMPDQTWPIPEQKLGCVSRNHKCLCSPNVTNIQGRRETS